MIASNDTRMPSLFRRLTAGALIASHSLFTFPIQAWAQETVQASSSSASAEPAKIDVNRTVPVVTAPPQVPVFSTVPTEGELLRARVFPEPLIPVGATESGENGVLARAISEYVQVRVPEQLGPISRFMESHTQSAWIPSLLLNAGLVYVRTGYFTRAAQDFRAAWKLAKSDTSRNGIATADRAIGELLTLESRLGHADAVEAILAELGQRTVTGRATEQVSNAKQALSVMRQAPEEAFRCGPYALVQMLRALNPQAARNGRLLMTRTGPTGSTFSQLAALAELQGITAVPIHRESGHAFGIPGVIHFKSGHFAAILRHEGDRYLLRDSAFNGDLWVSAAALDEEASGSMLVPANAIPAGWTLMTDAAARQVWGRGFPSGPPPNGPNGDNPGTPPCPCGDGKGLATYRVYLLEVSLNIYDMPVGYTPPVGPPVLFKVDYNQREVQQPQTFTYSTSAQNGPSTGSRISATIQRTRTPPPLCSGAAEARTRTQDLIPRPANLRRIRVCARYWSVRPVRQSGTRDGCLMARVRCSGWRTALSAFRGVCS